MFALIGIESLKTQNLHLTKWIKFKD